jgi:hypothetical protein
MGVNWFLMYSEVEGCKNIGEVEKFLVEKCGVEKGSVFGVIKKSLSNYGYNRDYRNKRNVSVGEMKKEIERLKKLVK